MVAIFANSARGNSDLVLLGMYAKASPSWPGHALVAENVARALSERASRRVPLQPTQPFVAFIGGIGASPAEGCRTAGTAAHDAAVGGIRDHGVVDRVEYGGRGGEPTADAGRHDHVVFSMSSHATTRRFGMCA